MVVGWEGWANQRTYPGRCCDLIGSDIYYRHFVQVLKASSPKRRTENLFFTPLFGSPVVEVPSVERVSLLVFNIYNVNPARMVYVAKK